MNHKYVWYVSSVYLFLILDDTCGYTLHINIANREREDKQIDSLEYLYVHMYRAYTIDLNRICFGVQHISSFAQRRHSI